METPDTKPHRVSTEEACKRRMRPTLIENAMRSKIDA